MKSSKIVIQELRQQLRRAKSLINNERVAREAMRKDANRQVGVVVHLNAQVTHLQKELGNLAVSELRAVQDVERLRRENAGNEEALRLINGSDIDREVTIRLIQQEQMALGAGHRLDITEAMIVKKNLEMMNSRLKTNCRTAESFAAELERMAIRCDVLEEELARVKG